MDRLAARYATAGGQTVDVRYRGNGLNIFGASGKCTGCHATTVGPIGDIVGELAAREWACEHAIQCTKQGR